MQRHPSIQKSGNGPAFILGLLMCTGIANATAHGQSAPQPIISDVRAQLYYEASGKLSDDILTAPDFVLWNTIIGEGSADEHANDLLLSFQIRTKGETHVGPINVVVTGYRGRVLLNRTIEAVLTSPQGVAWKGVMVYDIGCQDPLTVTATLEKSRVTRTLHFACGE